MSVGLPSELVSFQQFVTQQLAAGRDNMSPEEVIDLWRDDHPLPREPEETIAAVKEALADMAAGDRGRPIEEVDREIREKYFAGRQL
jgi:hypothetical protein